jgi:hypothetical protein
MKSALKIANPRTKQQLVDGADLMVSPVAALMFSP